MRRVVIVGGIILLFSVKGLACDCATPSAEESFRRADAVFIGEMIDSKQSENTAGSFSPTLTTYNFRVSKALKGKDAEEVTITSWGTDCDASFGLGSVYLVYAKSSDGKLISSVCSGNMALGLAPTSLPNSPPAGASLPSFRYRDMVAISTVAVLLCLVIWLIPWKTRPGPA